MANFPIRPLIDRIEKLEKQREILWNEVAQDVLRIFEAHVLDDRRLDYEDLIKAIDREEPKLERAIGLFIQRAGPFVGVAVAEAYERYREGALL